MADGWHKYRGDTYYVKDGVVQRGKLKIKGEEYYFSEESGIFRTGLCEINGGEYYFDDHGFLTRVLTATAVITMTRAASV